MKFQVAVANKEIAQVEKAIEKVDGFQEIFSTAIFRCAG